MSTSNRGRRVPSEIGKSYELSRPRERSESATWHSAKSSTSLYGATLNLVTGYILRVDILCCSDCDLQYTTQLRLRLHGTIPQDGPLARHFRNSVVCGGRRDAVMSGYERRRKAGIRTTAVFRKHVLGTELQNDITDLWLIHLISSHSQ
jgi:hypothetical protein